MCRIGVILKRKTNDEIEIAIKSTRKRKNLLKMS